MIGRTWHATDRIHQSKRIHRGVVRVLKWILITLAWPLLLGPAYWAVHTHLGHLTRWGKLGAYAAALYLWAVVLSLICYKAAAKWL